MNILNSLHHTSLRLSYKLENELTLPSFKGSALHGVMGYALKAYPEIYNAIFEYKAPENHPFARRYSNAPNPYTLFCNSGKTYYRKGDFLNFDLTLIGNASQYTSHILGILSDMGGVKIGNSKSQAGMHLHELRILPQQPLPDTSPTTHTLALQTLSPLRLMNGNQPICLDNPSLFMHRLVERLALLAHFHCDAELQTDYQTFLESAALINCYDVRAERTHTGRYSNRSEKFMHLDGWKGEIVYENVSPEILLALFYGQYYHIGKTATLGYGKYKFELIE